MGCVGAAGVEAEGSSHCPPEQAGGEAGQGAAGAWAGYMQLKKGVPAIFPIQIRKARRSQILVHDPSPCFASWKLERGRCKVGGGGGVWKTNCSYILGLWVLQAFEVEKKSFSAANW